MFVSIAKRFLFILAILLAATPAKAQQAASLVPPQLETDPGVSYPPEALKERFTETVTVTLVLELDAQGAVRKATVAEPRGHGFDEAAIAAAQGLVFEPARRDGTAIAAKIKFQYVFKAPPPKLDGRAATQASDRPLEGASVVAKDANGVEHSTTTAADGTWEIRDELPPGPVHVTITAPGKQPAEANESLSPGEETTLVLRLASEAAPPAVDVDAGVVEEVTVRGERPPREVTKRTLGKEEIEHIPGTNGDALRSLQNLPGVARPPPFSGALVVRGSAPEDTNIYVDGTNVPLVYHFGGLSSVVPTELLDKIDFYPGNFSTQYGRGMGGVVDVGLRNPSAEYHGMAQIDLIDLRALAEGPILNTGWKFLIAGRRSWFDLWLGPILKSTSSSTSTTPRYYDYQAMIERDFNSHSSFRLLFFGSDDALALVNSSPSSSNPTFGGDVGFHTTFWRIQARYQNKFTSSTELRMTAAFGTDSVDAGFGSNSYNVTTHPLSTRIELSQKVARWLTGNVGVDLVYEPYDLSLQLPPRTVAGQPSGGPGQLPIQSNTSSSLFLPGAYAELEMTPMRGMRIVPGVRADYDSATRSWDIGPRVNARQDLTTSFPRTTIKGGAGLFYQPPNPLETDPRFGQAALSSNRSTHYDVGMEQELTRNVELSVDAFYKSFDNLVESGSGNSGSGRAYGLEWLLRYKPDEHWFGWISYTLSRSERRTSDTAPLQPFELDQTHILTMIGSYKWGRGWQLGARFRLVSGDLYTPTTYGAFDSTVGSQLGVAAVPAYGSRLPLFRQLDVRIDKTWTFNLWKLSAYLDVQNILNTGNAEGVSYNYNYLQSSRVNGLPILPSLGLRAEF